MANSIFNLDGFRSEVLKRGLARNNRFEVVIPTPRGLASSVEDSRFTSMMAESTNFPPLNVGVVSQRIFGPSYQRPKYLEFGGDNIVINFLVDQDMSVKKFFEDWIELIIEPNTYFVGYQDEYKVDFDIHQLDEADNKVYTVSIIDAFPRSLNIMDLYNTNTNSFHRLAVGFAYRYWSSKGKYEGKDPVIIPNKIFREEMEKNNKKSAYPTTNNNWTTITGEPNQNIGGNTINPLGAGA